MSTKHSVTFLVPKQQLLLVTLSSHQFSVRSLALPGFARTFLILAVEYPHILGIPSVPGKPGWLVTLQKLFQN